MEEIDLSGAGDWTTIIGRNNIIGIKSKVVISAVECPSIFPVSRRSGNIPGAAQIHSSQNRLILPLHLLAITCGGARRGKGPVPATCRLSGTGPRATRQIHMQFNPSRTA
ncbi:MAG: hypothetical protein HC844_11965 [Tabrizicola sp.]|nr:hypothetical protein [Tabrizicola sp.]